MLKSLTVLLAFQALGELVTATLFPMIPGPVIGLLCLLLFFVVRKGVPPDVEHASAVFTSNLGLLFVPAAVGVVVYWKVLAAQSLALLLVLAGSVALTLAGTAWILDQLAQRFMPDFGEDRDA